MALDASKTTDMAGVLKSTQKEYGSSIGGMGVTFEKMPRLQSGIYQFDLATGGGIPLNKITIIYGGEGSSKTTLALKLIAQHQKNFPHKKCVFMDIENTFDQEWAEAMGVDCTQLVYIRPDYAEQAINIMEAMLLAQDCGLMVIDSIAAMATMQELNSDAEKANVGGNGLAMGKMVRKAISTTTRAAKEGNCPTLVLINQIRLKVGIVYGNPEIMPGGNAPRYAASMILKLSGKEVMDTKINKLLPAWREVNLSVEKKKCPIVSKTTSWNMALVPMDDLSVGEVEEWKDLKSHLEAFGLLTKNEKKGWDLFGETYPVQEAIKERFREDDEFVHTIKQAIIQKIYSEGVTTDEEPVTE